MPFFYSISKASKILDVCNKTIRRWDKSGKIKVTLTPGGHRRISEDEINRILGERNNKKVEDNNKILAKNRAFIYSRVSTKKQQSSGNLDRQIERLTQYAQENNYEVVRVFSEVASGINENRPQIYKMLTAIKDKEADVVIIEYKDRLTRFGYKYLEKYIEDNNSKIIVVEDSDNSDSQKELVNDLISIVTSFSARIYGKRGGQKVSESVKKVLKSKGDLNENSENVEN